MLRIREDRQAVSRRIEIARVAVGAMLSLLAVAYWSVQIVRGDGHGALVLNNIATTSSVARGDQIESAGNDGNYPRGVPIGRVESVSRGSKLFLEVRVTPSADFSRLTDVLLLAPSPATKDGAEAGRSASR